MAIRTYKVTLDSKNTIAPEPVLLRQGDKTGAVVIDATLMDNGSPVSLNGLTPMFKANTADGQAVIADSTGFNIVNASGGEFTYQVPNALSAVPGKIMTAYFSFSDTSGTESTFDVAFIIKKAVDITKPQANDYITIIDGTLQSLQQKIDAMNTDVQTILDAFNQGDFYNKTETDSKDTATLASAKSYADTQDTSTLASAKSYADTQDTSTLASAKAYADTQDAKNAITMLSLAPIAGATDPCIVTVVGDTLVNLQFNGKYPKKSDTIYWIDAKYAPKAGVSFAIPHNNIEGTQMIISIGSNGAILLVGNSDDKTTAFGSYTYNCKV